jgi:hypothetical protein
VWVRTLKDTRRIKMTTKRWRKKETKRMVRRKRRRRRMKRGRRILRKW